MRPGRAFGSFVALLLLAAPVAALGPQSRAPHGPTLVNPGAPGLSSFGAMVASLGDLDGDGFGDAAVGDPLDGSGAVFLFRGGPGGLSAAPFATLRGESRGDQFGTAIASVGDVDGDGRPDLAVGAPFARGAHAGVTEAGRVYLYLSGDLLQAGNPAPVLVAYGEASGDRLGRRIAGGGHDATGEGIPDLLVSAFTREAQRGWVYLLPGSARGTGSVGLHALASVRGEAVADELGEHALTFLSDLTGDGRAEWAIGAPEHDLADAGRVYVVSGLPWREDVGAAALRVFEGDEAEDGFGFGLATVRVPPLGELLAVGAFRSDAADLAAGRVYLVPPLAAAGPAAQAALSLVDGFDAGTAGASLAAGDFDGDGWEDLVVGAPMSQNASASPGEIGLVLGPLPLSGVVSAIESAARILGNANSGRFGQSVALVPHPDAEHPAGILVGQPRGASPRAHLLVNKAPVAVASNVEAACTGPLTGVTLSANGTFDPDGPGDIHKLVWNVFDPLPRKLGEGQTLQVPFPVGTHTVQLVVHDNYLAQGPTLTTLVLVHDRVPPVVKLGRPMPGDVHLEDDLLLHLDLDLLGWATHVGLVTVRASAGDVCSPIDRVEFWLDDQLMLVDREAPYEWPYDPHRFWPAFKHVYALAYDVHGNGPTADCIHVVNAGWVSLHHLPVVGEGPPEDWQEHVLPDPLRHVAAGEVKCSDRVDALLPDFAHPIDLL